MQAGLQTFGHFVVRLTAFLIFSYPCTHHGKCDKEYQSHLKAWARWHLPTARSGGPRSNCEVCHLHFVGKKLWRCKPPPSVKCMWCWFLGFYSMQQWRKAFLKNNGMENDVVKVGTNMAFWFLHLVMEWILVNLFWSVLCSYELWVSVHHQLQRVVPWSRKNRTSAKWDSCVWIFRWRCLWKQANVMGLLSFKWGCWAGPNFEIKISSEDRKQKITSKATSTEAVGRLSRQDWSKDTSTHVAGC